MPFYSVVETDLEILKGGAGERHADREWHEEGHVGCCSGTSLSQQPLQHIQHLRLSHHAASGGNVPRQGAKLRQMAIEHVTFAANQICRKLHFAQWQAKFTAATAGGAINPWCDAVRYLSCGIFHETLRSDVCCRQTDGEWNQPCMSAVTLQKL